MTNAAMASEAWSPAREHPQVHTQYCARYPAPAGMPEGICSTCMAGKQTLKINRIKQRHVTRPLELIHSDLGDLSKENEPSLTGSRYFLLFIDNYTRYTWVYFLKTKGMEEVLLAFKDFKQLVENQSGFKIKRVRCDNGKGEYDNKLFKQFLKAAGIGNEP